MARQQLNNLQGYDNTSQPTARTVDAFGGTPAMPKVDNSVSQIADAIGLVSNASMKYRNRIAAEERREAKQEEKALNAAKAEAFAKRWQAEEEGGVLTAVQMGEEFADVSSAVLSTLVQNENTTRFYTQTKEQLSSLDDSVLLDKDKTDELYASLIDEAKAATDGFDFAQAGAITGVKNAIREMSSVHATARDGVLRDRSKASIKTQVINAVNTTDDIEVAIANILKIDSEAHPFDAKGVKDIIVDALIQNDMNNQGQSPKAQKIIDSIGFLQGGDTTAKMAEASPNMIKLRIAKMKQDDYQNKRKLEIDFAEAQSQINALAEADDTAGLQNVMSKSSGLKGQDAILGNMIYAAAEAAIESSRMDETVSVGNSTMLTEDIKVAASTGDYAALGFDSEASLKDIVGYVNGRTDIRPEHKRVILDKLPVLMEGYKLVNNTEANNRFRNSFRESISLMQGNVKSFFLTRAGINVNTSVRNVYEDTLRSSIDSIMESEDRKPTPTEMREIYDLAVEKAGEKVAQLESLIDGKGNDAQEILDYGVLESPGVNGEIVNGYRFIGENDVPGSRKIESNWEKVEGTVEDTNNTIEPSGDIDDLGTAELPATSDNILAQANAQQQAQEATEEADAYADVDFFNRDNKEFELDDESLTRIVDKVMSLPSRQSTSGTSPNELQTVILEQLGLADNPYFDYRGLDFADEDGELAIQKLIEQVTNLTNNR